jgi:hypothetical protein
MVNYKIKDTPILYPFSCIITGCEYEVKTFNGSLYYVVSKHVVCPILKKIKLMEAKNKALELIEKVKKVTSYKYQEYAGANYSTFEHDIEELKKVALVMVEEILESQPSYTYWSTYDDETPSAITFWNEVKQELERL